MYYKSIMKRHKRLMQTQKHTQDLVSDPLSSSVTLHGSTKDTCQAVPRPNHRQEPTSHIGKCLSVREHSENIIHHLRKQKLSFRICLGGMKLCHKTKHKQREPGHMTHGMGPTWWVCVRSRDWWRWWQVAGHLCPLILASDNSYPPWHWLLMASATFLGGSLSPLCHKQGLQMQSFSLGSNLQIRMFLHLKKTSKENRVISHKRLFRENMTLSML